MRTIYKWRIPVADGPVPLALPADARLLHAEMALRGDVLTDHTIELWTLNEAEAAAIEQRWFIVRGTGHPTPEDAEHVATMRDGAFVWHLFEVPA